MKKTTKKTKTTKTKTTETNKKSAQLKALSENLSMMEKRSKEMRRQLYKRLQREFASE